MIIVVARRAEPGYKLQHHLDGNLIPLELKQAAVKRMGQRGGQVCIALLPLRAEASRSAPGSCRKVIFSRVVSTGLTSNRLFLPNPSKRSI